MEDLHFGCYTLDSDSTLSREGNVVPIPPKELELLKILLRHEGSTVSHEAIEQEIWPRQTVSYASISRCVYSLRKVLEDGKNTYIVTVPKRGYRFGLPIWKSEPNGGGSTALKVAQVDRRAYSHFLEGQRQANIGKPEAMAKARKLFERAYRADPRYAVAYSAAADCLVYQSLRGYIDPEAAAREGLLLSEQALGLDEQLASAHAVRGWFECVSGDSARGFGNFKTALSLDPEYATGYVYLSFAQRAAGMKEESVETARQAVELDPYSLMIRHALAWRLFCSGMPEEALEIEQSLTAEYPGEEVGHCYAGTIAAWLGKHEQSLKETEQAAELSGSNPMLMTGHAYALACAGRKKQAKALALSLANEELPRASRAHLAPIHAELGEFDRALELLQQAREEKCPWFRMARFDPRMGDLVSDERFVALFENPP